MYIGVHTKFHPGERAYYRHKDGKEYLGVVAAVQYYIDYKGHESIIYSFVSDGGFHKFYIKEYDIKKLNIIQKLKTLW